MAASVRAWTGQIRDTRRNMNWSQAPAVTGMVPVYRRLRLTADSRMKMSVATKLVCLSQRAAGSVTRKV